MEPMKIKSRSVFLTAVSVFILLCAFNLGIYFPGAYLNEIGLCLLVVSYGIGITIIGLPADQFIKYALLPAVVILGFIFFYAMVYSVHTGSSLVASILAQRNFIFFLWVPWIIMIRKSGMSTDAIEKMLFYAMAIATTTYFIVYMMIYIPQTLPFIKTILINILGIDQDRGIRVKGPMFIVLISLYYYPGLLKKAKNYQAFLWIWFLILCDGVVLILHQPRTLLIGGFLSLITLYVLSRDRRFFRRIMILLIPAVLIVMVAGRPILHLVGDQFGGNFSLSARIFSAGIAWRSIQNYPIFGLGFASHQSLAYQKFFGDSFYPDDIGLLGVVFQFGIAGGLLYVGGLIWLIFTSLKNLKVSTRFPGGWSVGLSKLMVFSTLVMLFIMPTIAKAIRDDGIGITAFIVGLLLSNSFTNPVIKS